MLFTDDVAVYVTFWKIKMSRFKKPGYLNLVKLVNFANNGGVRVR